MGPCTNSSKGFSISFSCLKEDKTDKNLTLEKSHNTNVTPSILEQIPLKKSDTTPAITKTSKSKLKQVAIPTLSNLMTKKKDFNQSINCHYPYYSLNFLVKDYLDTMNLVPALDINLSIQHIHARQADPLCVSNLSKNEKSELCRLMSRNAGNINFFKMLGFYKILDSYFLNQ